MGRGRQAGGHDSVTGLLHFLHINFTRAYFAYLCSFLYILHTIMPSICKGKIFMGLLHVFAFFCIFLHTMHSILDCIFEHIY